MENRGNNWKLRIHRLSVFPVLMAVSPPKNKKKIDPKWMKEFKGIKSQWSGNLN